jgi:hypothetical protein
VWGIVLDSILIYYLLPNFDSLVLIFGVPPLFSCFLHERDIYLQKMRKTSWLNKVDYYLTKSGSSVLRDVACLETDPEDSRRRRSCDEKDRLMGSEVFG